MLKMTNYYNCQWDRAGARLESFSEPTVTRSRSSKSLWRPPQEAGDIWWYEQLLESVKGRREAVIPQVIADGGGEQSLRSAPFFLNASPPRRIECALWTCSRASWR